MRLFGAVVSLLAFSHFSIMAQTDRIGVDLALPTDNDALFSGNGPAFYQYIERNFKGVKTTPWEGGQYGFVRDPVETSAGVVYTRFHEGIDVKPLRRDARDSERAVAPLRPAPGARLLDTTLLDIEAAFRAALSIVEVARAGRGRG